MADAERPAHTLAAPFPPPPPFYKHFTPVNIVRIKELRAAQEAKDGASTKSTEAKLLPTRIPDLPSELLFLQPPLPPTDEIYTMFGTRFTVCKILSSR